MDKYKKRFDKAIRSGAVYELVIRSDLVGDTNGINTKSNKDLDKVFLMGLAAGRLLAAAVKISKSKDIVYFALGFMQSAVENDNIDITSEQSWVEIPEKYN